MTEDIFSFFDLGAFLLSIDGGKRYDAVLMDIEWDKKVAGMDMAAEFFKLCPDTKIIYTTGYVELFSQQIFLRRANSSGLLTKPVDIDLLRANLKKVADALPHAKQPYLVLKQKDAPVSIPLREIYFVESQGHHISYIFGKIMGVSVSLDSPFRNQGVLDMYCTNCKSTINKDYEFCPVCTVKIAQAKPAKQAQNTPPFFKKHWKVALPVILILLVVVIGLGIFFSQVYPRFVLMRAFSNLGGEAAQRIDDSPLRAYGMLMNIAEDAIITADFDYRYDLLWGLGPNASGTATISTDTRHNNYAIYLEFSGMGMAVDLEAYINRERVAIGSRLLGGNFFGITYETFRDDVRGPGGLIGLSEHEMEAIADFVEAFEGYMNAPHISFGEHFEDFTRLLATFIRGLSFETERVEITSDGESIRARRITVVITQTDIANLLGEVHALVENDVRMRSYFDMYIAATSRLTPYYDEFFLQLRNAIRQFELYALGDITLEFYIDRSSRMLQAKVFSNLEIDSEKIDTRASFNFGLAVDNPWTLDLVWSDRYGREQVSLEWDFSETPAGFENMLEITGWPNRNDTASTFTTVWSPDSGSFVISHRGSDCIAGLFVIEEDGGFRLRFDAFELGPRQSLMLEIAASPGAQIGDVEFINIDQWDSALIGLIYDTVSRTLPFSALFDR